MNGVYDHTIAVDWSIRNMAIVRMTGKSNKITVVDVPSDVAELRGRGPITARPVREIVGVVLLSIRMGISMYQGMRRLSEREQMVGFKK